MSMEIFEVARIAGIKLLGDGPKRQCSCPFHEDKNPSAFISQKGFFHCPVCEGGALTLGSVTEQFDSGDPGRQNTEGGVMLELATGQVSGVLEEPPYKLDYLTRCRRLRPRKTVTGAFVWTVADVQRAAELLGLPIPTETEIRTRATALV